VNKIVAVTIAGFISVLCIPGYAHHSMTMFDTNKEVTLTGVVKEFQYTNPHSWLIIEASNGDGTTTNWGIEGPGPSSLIRAGIAKSDFSPGTKVTIIGHPMRDGQPAAIWVRATREKDGKEFTPSGLN
jgi:hypothetical protein